MNEVISEILKNNLQRENCCFSEHACKSAAGIRKESGQEKVEDRLNVRPAFFHDTDKIMHSLAYTRYIDKTQVFYLFENDHITHRVLHVQFVAKIARVIGRCLRLNEDLIEAIALGHDIGHVPYGHDGERYLDAICRERNLGYFCHNAQSVRFLMKLENRGMGLNLTLQVLDGILCHNGELLHRQYEPDTTKDWDVFLAEYRNCWTIKDFSRTIRPMTLEGCVMRVSDIIAYIGRDIEDAITLKLIKRDELPAAATQILGERNDQIINTLAMDLINHSYGRPYVTFSAPVHEALDTLMRFNYQTIYKNPRKQTEDPKIEGIFRYLYDLYLDQMKSGEERYGIVRWAQNDIGREYMEQNSAERIVVDYISGMTDAYFNRQFQEAVIPKSFGKYLK
jgi:dGTPase